MEALHSLQGLDFFLNVGDAIYGESRVLPILLLCVCLGDTEDRHSVRVHQCHMARKTLLRLARLILAHSDPDMLRS